MRRYRYAILFSLLVLLSPLSSTLFGLDFLHSSYENSFSVVSEDASEANNYTLVYELDIGTTDNYNSNGINYAIDNSENIDFTFDRVAYHCNTYFSRTAIKKRKISTIYALCWHFSVNNSYWPFSYAFK